MGFQAGDNQFKACALARQFRGGGPVNYWVESWGGNP